VAGRSAGFGRVVVFVLVNESSVVGARHMADGKPMRSSPDIAQ